MRALHGPTPPVADKLAAYLPMLIYPLPHNHLNKTNVFVKPNEQRRACSNIVMARKRTFRGTRKEPFILYSPQYMENKKPRVQFKNTRHFLLLYVDENKKWRDKPLNY